MKKIIIGIHGLGNKPPRRLFRSWWKRSLKDGMAKIGSRETPFSFEMVYWADILHPLPEDPGEIEKTHPLFLEERYIKPPLEGPKPVSFLKEKIIETIERRLDNLFLDADYRLHFSFISDQIIRLYFKEFEAYYAETIEARNGERVPAKILIRQRLFNALKRHRNKEILLIAHSMGSVIAYDVLFLGPSQVAVDTFVTIGSPLGLPMVVHRIHAEHYAGKGPFIPETLRCPDNIQREWFNLSDLEDKVALDHKLADDFKPNAFGVRPQDAYVRNDYAMAGVKNPHKDYGYLRTPELSRILASFLARP